MTVIPDSCVVKLHSSEQCQQEIDTVLEGKTEFSFNDRNQMPYMQVNKEMFCRCKQQDSKAPEFPLQTKRIRTKPGQLEIIYIWFVHENYFHLSSSRLLFMRRRGYPIPFHSASSTVLLKTQSLTVIPFPK